MSFPIDAVSAYHLRHPASNETAPEKIKYAGMMELVDMRDLGAVTSVKISRSISDVCDLKN